MEVKLASLLLFIILILGFGHTLISLTRLKRDKHPFVAFIETAGLGLVAFSFIAVPLNLLHIPLHYGIYLVLALLVPLWDLISLFVKNNKFVAPRIRIKKNWWKTLFNKTGICVLLLFVILGVFFFYFYKGAFAYPYLENDDPWQHAAGSVYVGKEMTYLMDLPDVGEPRGAFYLAPYPPNYDVIMGLLWQVNGLINWTLKYFNVILCMLAIAFAFLLGRQYFHSDEKGLVFAFVLAVLPSFMSHFIWSQSLSLAMFPVAFYAFLKGLEDKSWRIPAIIAIASMMVTQPIVSGVFGFVILFAVALIFGQELLNRKKAKTEKKKKKTKKANLGIKQQFTVLMDRFPHTARAFSMGFFGLLLSFLFWGQQLIMLGLNGILHGHGNVTTGSGWFAKPGEYSAPIYKLSEIIIPAHSSRIDQAVGFGLVVFLLVALGVIIYLATWKKSLSLKRDWRQIHLLVWLAILFTWILIPSMGFSWFGTSRFWAYLAIPFALMAAEATVTLAHGFTKKGLVRLAILVVLCLLIAWTSLPAKIAVQNALWPPGVHWTAPQEEIVGYMTMEAQLPPGSRVHSLCGANTRTLGFNMDAETWVYSQEAFKERQLNVSAQELITFMKEENYQYAVLDATCIVRAGQNKTQDFLNDLSASGAFVPIINQQGFLLMQVT